jgi:hypothetical protein
MTVPELSGSVSPTMDRVGGGPKSVALGIKLGITSLLRMPLTGVPSSVLNFAVTVTGEVRHKGRRRGYIETSLCPPGAQVPLLGNFTFRDGVVKSDKSTIVCGGVLP